MSKTVESYNYRIGLDVSGLQSGGILTRRELSSLRRDFGQLQQPVERSAAMLDRMSRAYAAGAIDAKQYAEAVARINARLPENVAAMKSQADANKQAADIQRSLMTDEQRYAEELKRMAELVRTTNLSRAEAAAHLKDYKAQLPGAVAATRELAEAEKQASQVRESLADDASKYAAEQRRLDALVQRGALTQEEANQALAKYKSQLPSVVNAERQRADMQQRGAAMTDRYATESEKLTKSLAEERAELVKLHRAGAIDDKTFSRGMTDVDRRSRPGKRGLSDTLSDLPMLDGLANRAGMLARLGPPLAILAVGLGAAMVAYKMASAAARAFADSVKEQTDLVVKMDRSARMLGTSVEDYAAIQFAASQNAGMSAEQTMTVVTKLSTKLSEAAAGGGDALASIQALGLNPVELAMDDPAIAFRKLVQAASEVENPIDRARIAAKLFEEEGIAMADVLAGGAAGLDAAKAKADAFGLTISDADAIGVTMAVDSIGELTAMWDGWARQVSVEFAPLVTAIAQTFSEMVPQAGLMGGGFEIATAFAVELSATLAETLVTVGRVAQVMIDIHQLDFAGLKDSVPTLMSEIDVGDKIRNNYANAKAEAQRKAAERKEEAEANRQLAAENEANKVNDEETKSYESELKQLKERNEELVRGKDEAALYKLENSKIDPGLKKEIADLRERNKELENAQKIQDKHKSSVDELKKARAAESFQTANAGMDDKTAGELAELQALGATSEELKRHVQMRRELSEIEERNKNRDKEKDRIKSLAEEGKKLRESYRLPTEVLAADFVKLDEMRRRDFITAEEHARAKSEAARALIEVPDDIATQGGNITDGSEIYSAMVEDQNAMRKREMEAAETKRITEAAEMLAQVEQARLDRQTAITDQMNQQVAAAVQLGGGDVTQASRDATLGNRTTAVGDRTTDGTPGSVAGTANGMSQDELLLRIATASEATSEAINNWQLVGV